MKPVSFASWLEAVIGITYGYFDNNYSGNAMQDYVDIMEIVKVADRIKNSDTWNDEDCRTLCGFADMEDEWDDADAEEFEQVMYRAADRLGVEII